MPEADMQVNYSAMETGAQEMSRGSQQINADLESMDAELRPTQSEWSGEAQQQYMVAKAEWTQSLQDMNQLLTRLGTHVSTSSGDYQGSDDQGAATFGA